MPVLFLILADQLGAPVHLAIAPEHFLVQYIDASGRRINIEATSGGHVAREEWIRQAMPMTDRAISAGVYLRPLSRREAVAHMALTVVDFLNQQHRYAEMADVSKLIIKNAPLDVEARVKLGTAYSHIIEREIVQVYGDQPSNYPPPVRKRFEILNLANKAAFDEAEALGWREASS